MEHITIPFAEVLGLDADLAAFMAQHWAVPDYGFAVRHHDQTMLNFAYAMSPMMVIRRKDGYDVLGVGRAYWLAQQLYGPEDSVVVLRIKSGRLRKEQKLQILAADLIIHHALARTRPHLAHQLYCLHQAIAEAGFIAIAETDPKTKTCGPASAKRFAVATGYSLDAVLPRHKRQGFGDPDGEPDL
ncbi:hypothetical protein [Thauera aromatica]|uniref:Uncharacterized protein n=1 Tax=Thauera aromatica K172 TaxID=44139 RepID=A0A2R4BIL3_THAAR|nr:hypothetical protein [Thauera aromatica]AVR87159.1 hypothetical protein Tharo_0208 [Thauera aromatica K172]